MDDSLRFYFHPLKKREMKKETDEQGSIVNKYPIVLDGGRTTIFISDKSKEAETREKYRMRRDNRVIYYTKKPKV
ncbi:MAG: hypothetical protein D4R67_03085 [Bacteroidetes bacterium]|nr:MAG: hypothetical protein D4R67_03085 [Bacteroidota bacterium]